MAAQAPMTEATYYILLALMKPGHGYGMMQRIKELSGGRIEFVNGEENTVKFNRSLLAELGYAGVSGCGQRR